MGHTNNYQPNNTTSFCPACESGNVKERWDLDKFQYGEDESAAQLTAHVPVRVCVDCGLEYTDERAERIRHTAVCRHLGVLPPEEVLAIRERYGKSQQDFSSLTKIGRASLARWETGSIFQNGSSDSLLFLLGFHENMERLVNRYQQDKTANKPSQSSTTRRFPQIPDEEISALRKESLTFHLFVGH
jgi:DNA-binding transcriptional regulator YiaG